MTTKPRISGDPSAAAPDSNDNKVFVLFNVVQAAWLMCTPPYNQQLHYLGTREGVGPESYQHLFADPAGVGRAVMAQYDYGRARVLLSDFRFSMRKLQEDMSKVRMELRRQAEATAEVARGSR